MMDSSWMLEQEKLKSQVICYDMYNWQHKRWGNIKIFVS
jgi:hypothetical protein